MLGDDLNRPKQVDISKSSIFGEDDEKSKNGKIQGCVNSYSSERRQSADSQKESQSSNQTVGVQEEGE
jgi:hypothetical protein